MRVVGTLGIVCSLAVLLCLGGTAWASTTYAYAAITLSGHGGDNGSDTDSAPGNCSSYADADCPYSGATYCCSAYASTTSRVTVIFGNGPSQIVGTSVTPNNGEASPYTGHTFTNNGSAYFWDFNAKLLGQGLVAQANLLLQTLDLSVLNTGTSLNFGTINLDCTLNSAPVYGGTFTLSGDGTCSGSGIYDPSNFNVYASGNDYIAEYVGPATLPLELPVNTTFSLELNAELDGDGPMPEGGGGGGAYAVGVGIPDGYRFTPEPASLSVLAIGALALLRRRK